MTSSVYEETISVLLFRPWFYNIGTLSCILGMYKLCTKLFFIKSKQYWGNDKTSE